MTLVPEYWEDLVRVVVLFRYNRNSVINICGWNYSVVICKINGKTINNVFLSILLLLNFSREKDRKRAQPFSFSQKRATGRFQRIPWAARLAWWIQNRLSQVQNWTEIVFICIVKKWCPEHFQFLTFLKALQLHPHDNETRTLINSDNLPQ